MRISINRLDYGKNSIRGDFVVNNETICCTLENKHKAIPAGVYELELYDAGRMDDDYAERFGEEKHPMICFKDVPGRTAVFIHILNKWTESDGCIGVGMDYFGSKVSDARLWQSEKAYKLIYYPITKQLKRGETVKIAIRDIKTPIQYKKIKGKYEKELTPSHEFTHEKEPIEETVIPIKIRFYEKPGFKRTTGFALLLLGSVFTCFSETTLIGKLIMGLGGVTETVGLGAGAMKNRKKTEDTKIDTIAILRIIADLLIKLFGRKK